MSELHYDQGVLHVKAPVAVLETTNFAHTPDASVSPILS